MQFNDLAAQQYRIRDRIDARVRKVLNHGMYIMGPEVRELEEALASFCGAKHCISCASGTDALLMPLMAWDVGPGDAVFIPSFSFFATAEVVAFLGATPIIVDIDPITFNIAPDALEKAIRAVKAKDSSIYPLPLVAREKELIPKAVIPVDLFGQAADYSALLPIAREHGLLMLEDAAQAFGAEYMGKKTCNLGCTTGATSFFPAKPLGCYGDGGALFTNDDTLAEKLSSIRSHGKGRDKYDNVRIGLNGRLDTLQAAILLPKLELLPEEILLRQQVARWYGQALAGLDALTLPKIKDGNLSAWGQYCVLLREGRNEVQVALKEKGIPSMIYYPIPMHMLPALHYLGYKAGDFPVALDCSERILALPFHPYMPESDVAAVAAALREVVV